MKNAILFSPNNIIGTCYLSALRESLIVTRKDMQHINLIEEKDYIMFLNLTAGNSLRYYIEYLKLHFDKMHSLHKVIILCREEHYSICCNIFINNKVIHDKFTMKNLKLYTMEKNSSTYSRKLTIQEKNILLLLIERKTKKQISHEYKISYKTVYTHIKNLASKLEIRNVKDLYRIICTF